jgi:methionyl-tRNA formyltransferase
MKIENLKLKIIFMGTPDFAIPILEAITHCSLFTVCCVITTPDKPVGRQQKITPPPVKKLALKYKIPVLQPEKISQARDQITDYQPDLIVVAAYGQILPKEILNIPKYGCINVHASLLPKYRGSSPIQFAILNDEKTTGVTIMIMDEKMDHGPILAQEKIAIQPNETAQTLHDKLARLGADLLIKTIPQYIQGEIKPQPQDESKATYTKILTRQDGQIDWQKSAQEIERQIRALTPWPGTWTIFNGKRLKILKAKVVNKKDEMAIQTGKGYLLLEMVQPEGKKPMKWEEFLRGIRKKANIAFQLRENP